MITEQHIKEQISLGFVTMVSGKAGVNLIGPGVHDYGVDGTFRYVGNRGGRRLESGATVDFQLKATTTAFERQDIIVYDCEARTYNALANRAYDTIPLILLVLCLDPQPAEWLSVGHDCTILKRACYWTTVSGPPTTNNSTVRIEIPKNNLFTPDELTAMLDRVIRTGQVKP
jgi:hypothetical protein